MSEAADRSIPTQPRRFPFGLAYLVLVGIPVGFVLVALRLGEHLPLLGERVTAPEIRKATAGLDLGLLVIQMVAIISAARVVGTIAKYVGQPRVVGEMVAGLLLGPSVLGRLAPGLSTHLFPTASLGFLNALAQVGLLLFMFLVGVELDPRHVRESGRTAVLTSHISILLPFTLGTLISLWLFPTLAPPGVPFMPFALFMGAAMSVTAFPVLARILGERGLIGTPLGALAIACAAVDDITAWCMLAAVVLVARAGDQRSLAVTVIGTAVYLAFMFTIGRRGLARLAHRFERRPHAQEGFLATLLVVTLASACITERLGIHALFGAFVVGALVPNSPTITEAVTSRLRDSITVLLLPLYFALTGLRTSVVLISGGHMWLILGAILLAAISGKFCGSALAARVTGIRWPDALALGALMNTRGLMELVFLNVGLDTGVLSPTLFAMMVIMAVTTTAMTTPLLDLVNRYRSASAMLAP
ncbi:MAG: putative sodium/hydrogen transporter [Gemmatimonadetes bacterium]|nr:putative sodium/hydrogen transporter [Gemmatimonadota bacterium]